MPTDADRTRLGDLLIRRRIEMDPAYANRKAFARERKIEYHKISDIERGRPRNFEPGTKAEIENAYGLQVGALDHAWAGGELLVAAQWEGEPLRLVTQAGSPGDTSDADDEDELALRRELAEAREELRQAKAQLAAIRAAAGIVTDT